MLSMWALASDPADKSKTMLQYVQQFLLSYLKMARKMHSNESKHAIIIVHVFGKGGAPHCPAYYETDRPHVSC